MNVTTRNNVLVDWDCKSRLQFSGGERFAAMALGCEFAARLHAGGVAFTFEAGDQTGAVISISPKTPVDTGMVNHAVLGLEWRSQNSALLRQREG